MDNNNSSNTTSDMIEACLGRLQNGETVEDCLRAYPEHQAELEPFLQTAMMLSEPRRAPSDAADSRMKAKMLAAYRENEQIEKPPVSYSDLLRYEGRNEINQQHRRYEPMNKQSFFTRFAGAIAGLAILLVVGVFAFTNLMPDQEQEAAGATLTPMPTNVPLETNVPMPTNVPLETNVPMTTIEPLSTESLGPTEFPNYESAVSPDGKWDAAATYVDQDAERYAVIRISDTSNGGVMFTPLDEISDIGTVVTTPVIVGWSADSRYFYYAETGLAEIAEQCDAPSTYFTNLSRLDMIDGSTAVIKDFPLSDIKMSPLGTELAVMNTRYNFRLGENDPLTVDMIDVMTAETTARTTVFDDSDRYESGILENRVHWSDDGTQLIAEMYTMPCPALGGDVGYQLFPSDDDGSPLIFSSEMGSVSPIEEGRVMMSIVEFSAGVFTVQDELTQCNYTVDLETKQLSSSNCPEKIDRDFSP